LREDYGAADRALSGRSDLGRRSVNFQIHSNFGIFNTIFSLNLDVNFVADGVVMQVKFENNLSLCFR